MTWMKIKTAAAYCDVSSRTLRKWLKNGLSHARLPSGTILINQSDLDQFLRGFLVEGSQVSNVVDEIVEEVTS